MLSWRHALWSSIRSHGIRIAFVTFVRRITLCSFDQLCPHRVSTHEQIADILTKTLARRLFVKFRDAIVTPLNEGDKQAAQTGSVLQLSPSASRGQQVP